MKTFVISVQGPVIELPQTHSQESLISFMSCGLFDDYRDGPMTVELAETDKKLLQKFKK